LLVTLPSPHLEALACPFTPKVLRSKECVVILEPSDVFTLDSHLSLFKSLGACQTTSHVELNHRQTPLKETKQIIVFAIAMI